MSNSFFCYAVDGDSTADPDMIRFCVDPVDIPMYAPFGQEFRGSDGQPMYAGARSMTVKFNDIPYQKDTKGNVLSSGSVKTFYVDWARARDSHKQRFTVNLYDPLIDAWGKYKCVILYPNWGGKELGTSLVDFELTLVAVGVDLTTAPAWGEPNPPAYSEDTATLGDPLVGTIGYGIIGRGDIGVGSDVP